VLFADMAEAGRNPARIIAMWSEFLHTHSGGSGQVHGIGEPIWAGRSAEELRECQVHEALLNAAFQGSSFRLLCPYDETALPDAVLSEARRTHPLIYGEMASDESLTYPGVDAITTLSGQPLPDAPLFTQQLAITGPHDLAAVRELVAALALEAGIPVTRREDLVLAAHEMASNSIRHSGGEGLLRAWCEPSACIFEFSDNGFLAEPMVGRFAPRSDAEGGRGFWLANHLCDLVQVSVGDYGTVVRLHAYR
jgi:anti-sigma regulatory factor (Ser/Thr protein kinase)